MVVLCTTQPPVYGADMVKIVPYGDPSPYIIMATSVTFALGALIVGSGAVFIIHCAKPDWFREVRHPAPVFPPALWKAEWNIKQKMMGSRFRLWATLVMLSLPCISLAFSIGSAVIGERKNRVREICWIDTCPLFRKVYSLRLLFRVYCMLGYGSTSSRLRRLPPGTYFLRCCIEDGCFWIVVDTEFFLSFDYSTFCVLVFPLFGEGAGELVACLQKKK